MRPDVVNRADRPLTTGIVNCYKQTATPRTCCSQLSFVAFTMAKSNRRRAGFYSQCEILVITAKHIIVKKTRLKFATKHNL